MGGVVVASHSALINGKEYDGIGNVLKATLPGIVEQYVFVRNSIDGKLPSEVQAYRKGVLESAHSLRVLSRFGPIRYVTEYYQSVKYFARRGKHIDVYVGIDPLNALSAIRLKRKGIVSKVIFYTADYSPRRFANPILNHVYHLIDRYCVKYADEVWSVSTRICDVRRKMGLAEEKNIFVPNVPPVEYDNLKKNRHDKYELITTGIIDKQLDFEGTIHAVAALKNELPKLHFTIIGNGPEEDSLKRLADKLGVGDRIEFTGRLPLEQALERQSRAGVGLALYTGVWGFNEYGDSTKCREYFNFGLPVISTDTHSTVAEVRDGGAGEVVTIDHSAYVAAIKNVIAHYDKYAQASKKAGERYRGTHKKQLLRVLSI